MAPFPHRLIRQRLIDGDNAATMDEKGAALEDVVVNSFCKIPGIRLLRRNPVDVANSSEIDLLLFNDKQIPGLDFLPNYLIFECKNWAVPVGSAEIDLFAAKVRQRRLGFGVFVAASGITGNPNDQTAAYHILRRVYDMDGDVIILITREEIEAFRSASDVVALIQEKCGARIMGL